jgi:predicted nucleotidyltransferase component of viral defense system
VSSFSPRRRWRGPDDLEEVLRNMPGSMEFAVRDFALVTLVAELSLSFPGQLVFKGGFVLRHVHGHVRFSKDVDATRHQPPRHKLDAAAVSAAISAASIPNVVRFVPGDPATDSARSLDFDKVRVTSGLFGAAAVQVEVSYREGVVGVPVISEIGAPFYEPFEILTMEPEEMAAEKLRTLAQRRRPTDLADLAVLLQDGAVDSLIAQYALPKFDNLVKQGLANRIERIEFTIGELAETYDDEIALMFPAAPRYKEAVAIVIPRIRSLVP